MMTQCPQCQVSRLSHRQEDRDEFMERHQTNCPGEDRSSELRSCLQRQRSIYPKTPRFSAVRRPIGDLALEA
jgi:hypothetical protein